MRIITGTARRYQLKTPKSELRPTMDKVRGAVYSTLELGLHLDLKATRMLDLFAGSGAYGIEALSRGAVHVDFVEKEPEAIDCIRQNLAGTKLAARAKVHGQEVFTWLNQFSRDRRPGNGTYDLVIADPPYERPPRDGTQPPADAVERLLSGPWDRMLTRHGLLVIEQSIERDIDEVPGLEILRFRRYGKTVVIYYALPGAYVTKDDVEGEGAD